MSPNTILPPSTGARTTSLAQQTPAPSAGPTYGLTPAGLAALGADVPAGPASLIPSRQWDTLRAFILARTDRGAQASCLADDLAAAAGAFFDAAGCEPLPRETFDANLRHAGYTFDAGTWRGIGLLFDDHQPTQTAPSPATSDPAGLAGLLAATDRSQCLAAVWEFLAGCRSDRNSHAHTRDLHRACSLFVATRGLLPLSYGEFREYLRNAGYAREGDFWRGLALPAPAPSEQDVERATAALPRPVTGVHSWQGGAAVELRARGGWSVTLQCENGTDAVRLGTALRCLAGSGALYITGGLVMLAGEVKKGGAR